MRLGTMIFALMVVSASAHAGTLIYGPESERHYIQSLDLMPTDSGKFNISLVADEEVFMIVDSKQAPVEYGYADAKALREDIMQKHLLGADRGKTLTCKRQELKTHATVIGCQIVFISDYSDDFP